MNTPSIHPALCLACSFGIAAGIASAQPMSSSAITPWPGVQVPAGSVKEITDQEIVIHPDDPAVPVLHLGWHQVQSIETQTQEHTEAIQIGRTIWNATLRLDRGDWTSAESLLEPLAGQMMNTSGLTTAEYFSALLRTRLARLDRSAAAQAWLHLRRSGDDAEPIAPELAPFYAPISEALVMPGDDPIARSHTHGLRWSSQYSDSRQSVQTQADTLFETRSSIDEDELLHVLCLASYAGSPETRAEARSELEAQAQLDDSFEGAWARFAIGRSLTLEESPNRVRLGIAGLIEVSIRDDATTPLLAGLALAEAAGVASRLDDHNAAKVLSAEFRRRFPGHPAEPALPISRTQPKSTPETSS